MGGVFSRWKKKATTAEYLEQLEKEIEKLEQTKQHSLGLERQLAFYLILYSVILYTTLSVIFYFYYMPETLTDKLLYSAPFLLFPILIIVIRKFLRWYFVKRVAGNDFKLEELRVKKKEKLEEVMEKETYKKAKEILEKYDPDRFKDIKRLTPQVPNQQKLQTPGSELRRRNVPPQTPGTMGPPLPLHSTPLRPRTPGPPGRPLPFPTPRQGEKGDMSIAPTPQLPPHMPRGMPGFPPGPPMPRSVPPRNRSVVDRVMDYVVGDGPHSKLALICRHCSSHNGMALPEEFHYLAFRCCYCFGINPARKQRPTAPRIDPTPPPSPAPSSSGSQLGKDDANTGEKDRKEETAPERDDSPPAQPSSEDDFDMIDDAPSREGLEKEGAEVDGERESEDQKDV